MKALAGLAAARALGQSSSPSVPGLLDAANAKRSLIGMQYENWFTRGNADWTTAEAVPLLSKYSSQDPAILRKHFEMFAYLGVDWLLIDWSNMLWSKPDWERHEGPSRELEKTVEVLFKTCAQLEREGKYAPKLVFMVGLQNGPPVPNGMNRLNGILAWLKQNYLSRPEYRKLWLYYSGKPLLTVLYWPRDPCSQIEKDLHKTALHADDWAIRWMSTQLQDNHADKCGMWSWMDGTIRQKVTFHGGEAEETVVTPACFPFPAKGWLHPGAVGRDNGAPYIESWKVAFENRPKFIQIHQWNEFAGQKEGQGFPVDYWGESGKAAKPSQNVFGDEYNFDLSDDIEPTSQAGCGYRGCGGWGYYYVNLTKALLSLYRKETPDITVFAASVPQRKISSREKTRIEWNFIGAAPRTVTISLDQKTVAREVTGSSYMADFRNVKPGKHTVTVVSNGVHTYFDLSADKLTTRSAKPLPVSSQLSVSVA
jgi:hypothetical protein